ncbi:MAG: alcohol dehydrogenase catalytic domain-containing protein [Armatimonadota bacterium]|nr:alcohol dehydrogenase catalytic domain-containing protein [Armatimonadota bacterium]
MRAVLKEQPGPGFVLKDVEEPVPRPQWVVIEVKAAGICGTDIPIFDGIRHVPVPLIPGHEISGVVARKGRGVDQLEVGDRVAIDLVISCGDCRSCRRGDDSLCDRIQEIGIDLDGGFAQYVAVPARNAFKLPANLSFLDGASIDPIASAYHAVRQAFITAKDTVAIVGPGPIGLYALQLVRAEGARRTVMVGTRPSRLEVAKSLGADAVVDLSWEDPVEAVLRANEGRLADIVIEATGNPDAVETACQVASKKGKIVLAGIFHQEARVHPQHIVRKELRVRGSFCYTREDFATCIQLVADGRVRTAPLITHVLPLDQIGEGLRLIKNREAIKVILEPNSDE